MCRKLLGVVLLLGFLVMPVLGFADDEPPVIPLWDKGAPGF